MHRWDSNNQTFPMCGSSGNAFSEDLFLNQYLDRSTNYVKEESQILNINVRSILYGNAFLVLL